MKSLVLTPRQLTLSILRALTFDDVKIELDPTCKEQIAASTETVDQSGRARAGPRNPDPRPDCESVGCLRHRGGLDRLGISCCKD